MTFLIISVKSVCLRVELWYWLNIGQVFYYFSELPELIFMVRWWLCCWLLIEVIVGKDSGLIIHIYEIFSLLYVSLCRWSDFSVLFHAQILKLHLFDWLRWLCSHLRIFFLINVREVTCNQHVLAGLPHVVNSCWKFDNVPAVFLMKWLPCTYLAGCPLAMPQWSNEFVP